MCKLRHKYLVAPTMRYSLWNLAARSDADVLVDALGRSGFMIHRVDTAGVNSDSELKARFGQAFDFDPGGWDAFADDMSNALLPDDDDVSKVALVWDHADSLLDGGLGPLLQMMDVLIDIGRSAYAEAPPVEIITFLMGDGPNFPRVDVHDMFPNLVSVSVQRVQSCTTY